MSIPLDFSFLTQKADHQPDSKISENTSNTTTLDFSFLSQDQNGVDVSAKSNDDKVGSGVQNTNISEHQSSNTALILSVGAHSRDHTANNDSGRACNSFAEAFSAIKQTKFYEPPPEPAPRTDLAATSQSKGKPRNPRSVLVRSKGF